MSAEATTTTTTDAAAMLGDLLPKEASFLPGAPTRSLWGSVADKWYRSQVEPGEGKDDAAPADAAPTGPVPQKLGMVGGVIIPCLLNIWGGIMFLRLGWVVGQAGIWLALLTLVLSYTVTGITTLSLSAIATNGAVKGGGIYFLIARSLGPMWGTMIGVLFYLAQAFASAMYAVGVAEVVVDLTSEFGQNGYMTGTQVNDIRMMSVLILTVLLGISFLGMQAFAKTQGLLFVIMITAIASVYIGSFIPWFPNRQDNYDLGFVGYSVWKNDMPAYQFDPTRPSVQQNFFTVFAVFFPAATGIMAGANVSGDLKNPSHAIPKGTLIAVGVTFVTYASLIFVAGLACERCVDTGGGSCPPNGTSTQAWAYAAREAQTVPMGGLLYNKIIFATIAPVHPFFYLGVFASSLSSALSSLVSAPRILQSVARDKVLNFRWLAYLAVGRGADNNPVRALYFSFAISLGVSLIGNLDAIATLISNVFLASYGLVNLACFGASRTHTAGWRPTFKAYNKWVSLLGAFLCLGVMALIDWVTTIITVILCLAVYRVVELLDPVADWGAANDSNKYSGALTALDDLATVKNPNNVKLFRAHIFVMSGPAGKRSNLVKFASMFRYTKGLVCVADVVESQDYVPEPEPAHKEMMSLLGRDAEEIHKHKTVMDAWLNNPQVWGTRCPGAFSMVSSAPTVLDGFKRMFPVAGVSNLRPNTVLLGFPWGWKSRDPAKVREFELMVRTAMAYEEHGAAGIMILRDDNRNLDIDMNRSIRSLKDIWRLMKARVERLEGHEKRKTQQQIAFEIDADAEDAGGKADAERSDVAPVLEENLPMRVSGLTIDVWWLADDGGYTVLLPHILSRGADFRRKKIRVFTVVDLSSANKEDESLDAAEKRMIQTMFRLRIPCEVVALDVALDAPPTAEMQREFESLGVAQLSELNEFERAITVRQLNLANTIREHSGLVRKNSARPPPAVCFVTMPLFHTGIRVKLFSAWMETLTARMPPTVLIRGNGQQCVTTEA